MESTFTVLETDTGDHCLRIAVDDDVTIDLFDEYDLQGSATTWEGIVHALIRREMPEARRSFELNAESDGLEIHGKSRGLLDDLCDLLNSTLEDDDALRELIEAAGDELE